MAEKPKFKTLTLAKVYAGQGKIEKALEITRELIRTDPKNRVVKKLYRKLAGEKTAALEQKGGDGAALRLTRLFQEWFDLLLRLDRLKKLKKASVFTSGHFQGLESRSAGETISAAFSKYKGEK